ncbi:MAG: Ig-like domain-containing protein [Candidatus Wallbacteria bacterium]
MTNIRSIFAHSVKFLLIFTILVLHIFINCNISFAIAPPLDPTRQVPENLLKYRFENPGGYGRMIQPERSGMFYAPGEAIGGLLQNKIKTNPDVRLLVILVEFSDVKMASDGASKITTMLNDLKKYFADQSVNKVNVIPTIKGLTATKPYLLPNTMASYGSTDNANALIGDAITVADGDTDYSQYDCLMVAHAGYGDESNTGSSSGTDDIWSQYYYTSGGAIKSNTHGVVISGATVVPELEHNNVNSLGVICHEFGHQFGLPDLYDTTYNTEGGIGKWTLMATGSYNGTVIGATPAPLDPWCRNVLGWADIQNVTSNIASLNFTYGKTYRFEKDGASTGDDFYYAEIRKNVSGTWDSGLPGEGLLIFHINKSGSNATSMTPNNSTPRLIQVMTANNGDHLTISPRSKIRGLDTDPYPTSSNKTFNFTSSPSSKKWDNTNSYIGLINITKTGTGSSMSINASAFVNAELTKVSGDSPVQSVVTNSVFPTPFKVNVSDATGPLANVDVTFTVSPSGSAVISESQPVKTDSLGNAQITLTAGANPASLTINAAANISGAGLTSKSLNFGAAIVSSPTQPGDVSDTASVVILKNASEQPFAADGTTGAIVEITIYDAQIISGDTSGKGNPIPNCDVWISSDMNNVVAGADLFTPSSMPIKTDSSGRATYTIKTSKIGLRTITVRAQKSGYSQKTLKNTLALEFKSGGISLAASTVNASRTSGIVADGNDSAEITVMLKDSSYNPVAGKLIALSAAPADGITITPGSGAYTDGTGMAKFYVQSGKVQTVTISAVLEGGAVLNQKPVLTFISSEISTSQSTVTASEGTVVADGEHYSVVTITLRNASGQPIKDVQPVYSVTGLNNKYETYNSESQGTLLKTNYEGKTYLAIASTTAEKKKVTITANGVKLYQEPEIVFTADDPVKMNLYSGNNQVGIAGQELGQNLQVQLFDKNNNLVSGKSVTFKINQAPSGASGHGIVNGSSVVGTLNVITASNGIASVKVKLGNKIGQYTFLAEYGSVSGSPVMFTARADSGGGASITKIEGDNQNSKINPIGTAPNKMNYLKLTVRVADEYGNYTPNVIVKYTQNSKPSGAADCTFSTGTMNVSTDSDGYAVSLVALGDKVGDYQIKAAFNKGDNTEVSTIFNLKAVAGDPAAINKDSDNNISGDSQEVLPNTLLPKAFKVKIVDSSDNAVGSPIPGCKVTFSVQSGTGNFGGNNSIVVDTNSNGEAIANYTAGSSVGVELINVYAYGNYSVIPSNQFKVYIKPGAASKIVNGSAYDKYSTTVDTNLASPFIVKVTDNYGNAVSGHSVNLSIGSVTGSVNQAIYKTEPADFKTDQFGFLKIYAHTGSKPGTYKVTASITGASVEFGAIATAGIPDYSRINYVASANINSVIANGSDSAEIAMQFFDSSENLISNSPVNIYISSQIVAGVTQEPLSGSHTYVTDNNGWLKFKFKSLKTGVAEFNGSLSGTIFKLTPKITFISGPMDVTRSIFKVDPISINKQIFANKRDTFEILLNLKDANDNPVSGFIPQVGAGGNLEAICVNDPLNTFIAVPAGSTDLNGNYRFNIKSSLAGDKKIKVKVNGTWLKCSNGSIELPVTFQTNKIDFSKSTYSAAAPTTVVANNSDVINLKVNVKDTSASSLPVEGLNSSSFRITIKDIATSVNGAFSNDINSTMLFNSGDGSYNFAGKCVKAGTYEVTVEVLQSGVWTSITGNSKPQITYLAGAAAMLKKVDAADPTGIVGETSISTLKAMVVDAYGNPVANSVVNFTVTEGAEASVVSAQVYTNSFGIAETKFKLGKAAGWYKFRADSFLLGNTQTCNFNVYAFPGAAFEFKVNNIPASVMQCQNLKQLELVVYDSYRNIKTNYSGSVFMQSNDETALLPYPTAVDSYTFKTSDYGRKVFTEGVTFFKVNASNSLTFIENKSISPIQISKTIPVTAMPDNLRDAFKAGSFFIPGTNKKALFIAVRMKRGYSNTNTPYISYSIDGGAYSTQAYMENNNNGIYFCRVSAGTIKKCKVKIFCDSDGVNDPLYTEAEFNY